MHSGVVITLKVKTDTMKTLTLALATALLLGAAIFTLSSASINDPAHWAEWRGPSHNGVAPGDAPTTWSNSKNIKWKADIPGRGHSTPVIWGDKIFLTTAIQTGTPPPPQPEEPGAEGSRRRGPGGGAGANIEHKFVVMCLDRKTGKTLWQQTALTAKPHEGYHRMYGSFASNSPITDGKYLYAFFGSRGIYVYDLNGKKIWEKDLGVQMQMRLQFGEGVAPAIDKERIFLTFDHQGESFIVALDKSTGKEVWRTPRDEESSWSTPLIVEDAGRQQLIVSASNKVTSYDPATGKVIWECGGLGSNVIPAPVYQDGVFFVMSGHRNPNLMAIQPSKKDSKGDLTGTDAVLWSHNRGIAYTLSPVLHDNKLYVITDSGLVSVFDIKTGEPFYQQVRLPRPYNFKASPVAANGKLYLASEEGDVIVLKMGEKFEVVATNTLEDQMFIASPVIAGGDLFLRSQNTLFCISD